MPVTVRGILDGLRNYLSLASELFQGGKEYSLTDDMMAAHGGTCTRHMGEQWQDTPCDPC